MSDMSSALDEAVAAAKTNYAVIDDKKLKTFLDKVFGADVSILRMQGGAEKSGSSSGILIFDAAIGAGESQEIKKLVLRYDPQSEDRIFFEYDLESQYVLINKLQGSGLPIPKVYGIDVSGDCLGVSGFIMDCVDGSPIPTSLFASGPLVDANDEQRAQLYQKILNTLVSIHSLDYVALGLGDFTKVAPGNTAQEKLINWWWKTWDWAKPEGFERLVPVRQWLLDNAPVENNMVLMHGDPNLGNYMLNNGEVAAILDWELSSIGSPELDLAIQVLSMEAHMPYADQLPVAPPTQEQWLSYYYEAGGRPLKNFDYFRKQAAYQILVCLGSMCNYLPESVSASYKVMAEFYWAIVEAS
jgi:aminoglycoside phosphotransferase (APT) family kinase protein